MSGTAPESKQLQEAHLLLYPYGKLSFIAIDKMQEKRFKTMTSINECKVYKIVLHMLEKEITTIIDNKTICKIAEQWLKTPFRWHGITKKGCDCAGLIIGVLNDLNAVENIIMLAIQRFHYGNNLKSVNKGALLMLLLLKFEIVDDIKNADVLMLETKHSPIHFAFYNQKTKQIIHSTRNQGVVKNNFDRTRYTTTICFLLKNKTENKKTNE